MRYRMRKELCTEVCQPRYALETVEFRIRAMDRFMLTRLIFAESLIARHEANDCQRSRCCQRSTTRAMSERIFRMDTNMNTQDENARDSAWFFHFDSKLVMMCRMRRNSTVESLHESNAEDS